MQFYQSRGRGGEMCSKSLISSLTYFIVEMRLNIIGLLLCHISSEAEVFGINFVFVDTVQHLMPPNVKPANFVITCLFLFYLKLEFLLTL